MTSPTSVPAHLLALDKPATPGRLRGWRAAIGDRQRGQALPAAGADQDTGRDGVADLAGQQRRRRRPRAVVRGLRQPHAGAGSRGGGPAELGDRGRLLSVAAARVGRRPRPAQPGLAGRCVDARRRAGTSPLASAGRWLPAAAGRLGAVRRARRGGDQVQQRRAVHRRRRLAAGPDRERAQVPGSVRRPGGARIRQQRRAGERAGGDWGSRGGRDRTGYGGELGRDSRSAGGHPRRRGRPAAAGSTPPGSTPPGSTPPGGTPLLPTAGTISRRRAGRGQRPSRRSSAW